MVRLTIKDKQKPTKAQLSEVQEAASFAFVEDVDCPPSDAKALEEFAKKARELRSGMRNTKPAVTIRLTPECLKAYKALGKGYTGIMADILAYAVSHPKFVKEIVPNR
jgi:uncharacterized protein (DUF4415 family)